jgi:hypothetical protein
MRRPGVRLNALRVTPNAIVVRVASERVEPAVRALHAEFLERE